MTQNVYEPLRLELARAIATTRTGKKAGRIAEAILEHDDVVTMLVGLDAEAERAIYYEFRRYSLLGIPFDEDGLGSRMGSHMERLEGRGAFQKWLAEQDPDEFAWMHPRYHWLFDCQ